MRVMTEESFGPVVGIARVTGDDEAVALMNDSAFGLTASVWTQDEAAGLALGARVETGTLFVNRCDYLDPMLAWTGVKDSGRGCTLSRVGFEQLTRPKSFHLRRAQSAYWAPCLRLRLVRSRRPRRRRRVRRPPRRTSGRLRRRYRPPDPRARTRAPVRRPPAGIPRLLMLSPPTESYACGSDPRSMP